MYDFIAIIPARAGSKTIKNKNMIDVCGKPLIQYTIDECLKRKLETYVLTDDESIIRYIKENEFNKVSYIHQTSIGDNTIIDHNLLPYLYPRFKHCHAIYLQPTSPIRMFDIIDRCISAYDGSSCLTVEKTGNWTYKGNSSCPLFDRFNRPLKKDPSFTDYYFHDGNVIIRSIDDWENEHCIVSANPVLVENNKINCIQIDYPSELEEVRNLISMVK